MNKLPIHALTGREPVSRNQEIYGKEGDGRIRVTVIAHVTESSNNGILRVKFLISVNSLCQSYTRVLANQAKVRDPYDLSSAQLRLSLKIIKV